MLYAKPALDLKRNLLSLNPSNHLFWCVLWNNLIVVQHLKLLGRITAHEVHDGLWSTWMLLKPVTQIHNDTLDNDPQVTLGVVLCNLLHGVLLLWHAELSSSLVGRCITGLGLSAGDIRGGDRGSGYLSLASWSAGGGGRVVPLDGDLAWLAWVDVERDLAETLVGATTGALEGLLEEVVGCRVTGNTSVDDTAEKGGSTKTVSTVDTASKLTAGVEAIEWLALLVENLCLVVDLDTTHGEVENWLHQGNVEVIVNIHWAVVEEALSIWILLLASGNVVVLVKGGLEVLGTAADLLCELLAGHLLHETTASVVASVEIQNVGCLGVEDEANRELALVLLLPHLTGDVITMAKLVAEAVAICVEEETTLTTESLSGQELPFGSWILWINQASWVNLDLVHVNAVSANGHNHLLSVASGVGTVGGGEVEGIWAMLLEKGGLGEISSVTTSGQDDWAVEGVLLALKLVVDTGNQVTVLVDAGDASLLDDLDTLWLLLGELLEADHQGVSDGHTWELCIVTTVGSWLGVSSVKMLTL